MIALINPPGIRNFSGLQPATSPNPPVGLAYIAGALKEKNYEYEVIDAPGIDLENIVRFSHKSFKDTDKFYFQGISPEDVVERIPENTKIIGISCLFSVSWILTNRVAYLARKKFPSAILVLGGEHGSACPEYCLDNSTFDIIAVGEGETLFVNLVEAVIQKKDVFAVNGIVHKKNGKLTHNPRQPRIVHIDSIARPDWDSFPIENYIDKHQNNGVNIGRSMPIISTRGCPHQCTFCSSPNMWTTRYTLRDADDLIDEMKLYMRKYNVTNFDFQDLTAITKRSWAVDFCKKLIDSKLNITWQLPSGTRSEAFDEELVDLIYRSGCKFLALAPESGSPEVLEKIKKRVNLENLFIAAKNAINAKISVCVFIVIGFPCDTKRTIRETTKFIRKCALAGIQDIVVSKFSPYPGSELFYQLQEEGKVQLSDSFFVSDTDHYAKGNPSYSPELSNKRLYWTMIWMFLNFYIISGLRYPHRFLKTVFFALFKEKLETRYARWIIDKFVTRKIWEKRSAITKKKTFEF